MDYILLSQQYMGITALSLWIIVTLVYLYGEKINKWAIIDIFWGLGFVFTALLGWIFFSEFQFNRQALPVLFISMWGIRLAVYLGKRVVALKTDDQRYIDLKNSGMSKLRMYFQVFVLQAVFLWIMCLPLYFYMVLPVSELSNTPFVIVGSIISVFGLIWEWTADYQLSIFKKPQQLVKEGLWKYSRHPNYFGEISFWIGIWFMTRTFSTDTGSPLLISMITLLSPILIMIVLFVITGPMLERNMARYSEWAEYKQQTPYIIPKIK